MRAYEVVPGKKLFITGPAGKLFPRYDKNLLLEMKMVPLPVGAKQFHDENAIRSENLGEYQSACFSSYPIGLASIGSAC